MIKVAYLSKSQSSRLVFSDSFPGRSSYYSLFINYYEDNPVVYPLIGFCLNEIMEFIATQSELTKESLLDYFNNLNWIVSAKFNSFNLKEHGFSLGLVIVKGSNITVVRYGRVLLGKIKGSKLSFIGPSWVNYTVKSIEQLSLIGHKSENTTPEVYEFSLVNGEEFILTDSDFAEKYSVKDKIDLSRADLVTENPTLFHITSSKVTKNNPLKNLFNK